MAPIFLLLMCYTVDFGYFYLVAAGLTASAHNAALYSIQGFESVAGGGLPKAGPSGTAKSVAALALGDVSGFAGASTTVEVYVCSNSLVTSTSTTRCASYSSAPVPSNIDTDPESTLFTLNRVDVYYTISPPIRLGGLLPTGIVPSQFRRSLEMRALN